MACAFSIYESKKKKKKYPRIHSAQRELTSRTTKRPFLSGYTKAKDILASLLLAAGVTSLTCERDGIKMAPKILELKHSMQKIACITTENKKQLIWHRHE